MISIKLLLWLVLQNEFQTAEPGDDIVSQLKLVLKTIPIIMNVFSFFMVAVGSFLVLSAFVLSILYALGKIKENPNILSSKPLKDSQENFIRKKGNSFLNAGIVSHILLFSNSNCYVFLKRLSSYGFS
ncbi:UNVERIFIED_CONTAM: hypothetical protein NCL1_27178 [Trichonephila clavipes]